MYMISSSGTVYVCIYDPERPEYTCCLLCHSRSRSRTRSTERVCTRKSGTVTVLDRASTWGLFQFAAGPHSLHWINRDFHAAVGVTWFS